MSALSRRLGKIEARRRPVKVIPNAITRYHGEPSEDAVARFCKQHGIPSLPEGHRVLFVTAFPTIVEFAAHCRKQQSELIAMARTVKGQL